jgi:hypothetical protein
MSRAQETSVVNTAKSQNATNFGNAQTTFGDTQSDIGNYQNQLNKFVSGNPYTAGGEYSSTINPALANASDAGSNSLKGALQSQVLKTGQNSAADAATAASAAQANTRNLSSSLASADQQRINSEAGYNQQALGATSTPISAESSLYGTSGSQGNQQLSTEEGAAQAPSFWDEVGSGLSAGLGKGFSYSQGNGGPSGSGCWIAREAFGSWEDERTQLVRGWIFGTFQHTKIGGIIAKLYLRFGERIAAHMRTNRLIRWMFVKLANLALRQARREK